MYDLMLNAANAIPFVLVDSLNVEVPGLGAAFTVLVAKNSGDFAASTGSKAELGGGWYLYTAPAGECDTPGPLPLRITAAGCAQQNLLCHVASGVSSGQYSKVYTVLVGGVPRAGAYCRLATQANPTVNLSAGISDSLGQVTFWHNLPTGTPVYVYVSLDGYMPLTDLEVI